MADFTVSTDIDTLLQSADNPAARTSLGVINNATHTGDVTGDTALTIAVDAVDIPMLSATGAAGATTFLRGDNTWATPAGGGGSGLLTDVGAGAVLTELAGSDNSNAGANPNAGSQAFIVGSGNYGNTSNGEGSVIGGQDNYGNNGWASTVTGVFNHSNSGEAASISGNSNFNNSGDETLISGKRNQNHSGGFCAVFGEENKNNSGNHTLISGSFIDTNSGNHSIIAGTGHTGCSGNYNVVGGNANVVVASNNAVFGTSHGVTRSYCLVSGDSHAVNSNGTLATGYAHVTTTDAEYSSIVGIEGKGSLEAATVISGGKFQNTGDAQAVSLVTRATTTSTSPVELKTDSNLRATLIEDGAWAFDVDVVAADKAMFNSKRFKRNGLIMRKERVVVGEFTVNTATDVITVFLHGLSVNDPIRFTTSTDNKNNLPAGLDNGSFEQGSPGFTTSTYYVLTAPDINTITVSLTPGGAVVDITDAGSGTHSLLKTDVSLDISAIETIGTDLEIGAALSTASVAITADAATNSLKIAATGVAATDIHWVASIKFTSVSFPNWGC